MRPNGHHCNRYVALAFYSRSTAMKNLIICFVIPLLVSCNQTLDTWSESDTNGAIPKLESTPTVSKRTLIKLDTIPSRMEVEGQYTCGTTLWVKLGKGAYLYKRDATTFDAVFEPNSSEGIVVEQVKRMAMTKSRFIIEHFDTAAGTLKICAICSGLYGEWRRKCSCCYYPKEFLRDRIHEFYFSELEKRRIRDSMIEVQRVWLNPELVLKP